MAITPNTGIEGLDAVLSGLRKGDNIVWQVDNIADYKHYVTPYINQAINEGRNIVYMRFAQHEPLVADYPQVKTYQLDPAKGFEQFSKQVHNIITEHGLDAYYLFDCLSDLLTAWATDLMIGNFFMITCPYLYELDTITYFAILRGKHSFKTIARIRDTTQLLLDVYHFEGDYYVHPLKVLNRYSPTMFLPHRDDERNFIPITSSIDATRLLSHISEKTVMSPTRVLDSWDKYFMKAEALRKMPDDSPQVKKTVDDLCRLMIGREKRMLDLVEKYMSLDDLINIKSRLIGSGYIGGKTVGMLLAQKILMSDESFNWSERMEPHDSFYVGSDVFYSYIVENGWWKLLMEQKTEDGYFSVAPQIKENMLKGKFPDEVKERFQELIEYFGQSPIIVRSSSLLEDSFGNAFAGKYESIFLANQGDPDQRYHKFEAAVRRIYASTMNVNALTYRLQRGLSQSDEQMALLVQRVSGSYHKDYFFPHLAGVGISYNTFVWEPDIDPEAGMLRLVFGLGTRAVERVEDDYPQIIALDQPLLRPYSKTQDVMRYSQHKVDLLHLTENKLSSVEAWDILKNLDINISMIASIDRETEKQIKAHNLKNAHAWVLTFEKLLSETDFTETMRRMLKTLEENYKYPVDVEFTANFSNKDHLRINLVQCRPLQTKGLTTKVVIPDDIKPDKILFEQQGHNMGGNISMLVKHVIYVEPTKYQQATQNEKYDIARLVGQLNRQIADRETMPTILMGPGRWGTTTPSLGVPVSFAEINKMTVMVEIAYEGGNLMPELSFGTHFFQDLVETDIFYVAIFPGKDGVTFNREHFAKMPNTLSELLPESAKYQDMVRVFDVSKENLQIMCDVISHRVVSFFD
ncbi:MAG: PEP/pyruvate-binding domain-containing protein [Sedimentisphaerales bacterium]|nr:PEP/pyruvate-binding domain-containing protein [Sedimentisphaerales bacterium]